MKRDEKWGWQLAWAGVGLILLNVLLGCLSPGVFGWNGILFYGVAAILCLIDLAAVYVVFRKFFSNKKESGALQLLFSPPALFQLLPLADR